MQPADIRALEEVTLNAWPSLQQILLDGWVLRFAAGYTRRANSVNPLYEGHLPVDAKIAQCEDIYRRKDLRPVFKMTAAASPDLAPALQRHGYREEARTSVQIRDLAEVPEVDVAGIDVRSWPDPSAEWLETYTQFNAVPASRHATLAMLLNAIATPAHYLALLHEGQPAAVGLVVCQNSYAGLFDIVTRPDLRNRGLGRILVARLLAAARSTGATHAYLQVMNANCPALRLYHAMGFHEAYQYWYLTKD